MYQAVVYILRVLESGDIASFFGEWLCSVAIYYSGSGLRTAVE